MIGLTFDNAYSQGDLDYDSGIQQDDTLRTFILICLFTDRQADTDDEYPEGQKYGWWGDTFAAVPGDKIGSKLWQLNGRSLDADTVALANDLVKDALQCMLDDGVAESVEPNARIENGMLRLGLFIKRPSDPASRYYDIWESTLAD